MIGKERIYFKVLKEVDKENIDLKDFSIEVYNEFLRNYEKSIVNHVQ